MHTTMQGAGTERGTGSRDAGAELGALANALTTMGLERLDPADIAPEFRDPLIRLSGHGAVRFPKRR